MPAKEGCSILRNLKKLTVLIAASTLALAGLSGCSTGDATPDEVTVVTHDSVLFTDEVIKAFKDETGITIKQIKAGDTGAMTNKLVLTKDAPIGDAFFGIDNTFAGVAIDNDIVSGALEPVDFGDVCFNYDKTWFSTNELPAPTSIKDLTKPAYRGLTVVSNPTTSSPGLAFLAATVSMFGDNGWEQYWTALKANDVKVAAGWEDAYFTDFSGSSGKGAYPIVLSYSSSPAFEIRDNGESQTASILDGCFRQTEYAGVLNNAKNPDAAKKLVLFLINETFQKTLPTQMYVYPVLQSVELPGEWKEFAPVAENTYGDALDINANRKDWFTKWSEIFSVN
jgi:thiamine transport system substrate-binding protein